MFEDQETTRQMQSTRDGRMLFEYLSEKHNFRQEYLDTLYRYAKFQYECGNYSGAAEYLYFFRVLVPATDRNALSSLWGKLASEILMQNWEAAMEDLTRLRETIDNNKHAKAPKRRQELEGLPGSGANMCPPHLAPRSHETLAATLDSAATEPVSVRTSRWTIAGGKRRLTQRLEIDGFTGAARLSAPESAECITSPRQQLSSSRGPAWSQTRSSRVRPLGCLDVKLYMKLWFQRGSTLFFTVLVLRLLLSLQEDE
ncbi:hypothetical protein CRUP_008169 [Coryphaenoides rupestris]|nr:hypothetical protein CRUP_008169 [Coryphaenoides rupestris]